MDVPIQRILKIGRATVGLVGLDVALNRVLAWQDLPLERCVENVYEAIAGQNYIPTTAAASYKQAIAREIVRLRENGEPQNDELVIRILGPGCVSCNNLQTMVIEIMNDMGIAADVFQVHDLDEIGRFGVMQTPALLINGTVKCAGRLPTRAKIEEWLREVE
nr:thioredoxin family protein [Desulfobulbaceae bacterium]